MESLGFGENTYGGAYGIEEAVPANYVAPTTYAALLIDNLTKDFVIEGNGLVGIPPTRQRVLLALLTKKGSSSTLPEFGSEILNIRKINQQTIKKQLENYVRKSLAHIDECEIQSINILSTENGNISYEVNYIDRVSLSLDTVTL